MVAYSFKPRFAPAISAGIKKQTIRADRKRHVRDDETMQLYTGMRTRQCRLIGTALCKSIWPIRLHFDPPTIVTVGTTTTTRTGLDSFARRDGFESWDEMSEFWRTVHGAGPFTGVLIEWMMFERAVSAK